MWHYLKAAFLVRMNIPVLGRVPVNLLAVVGFGILGFGEPAVWPLGLGLETTFLFALAFNRRFQKVVDAGQLEHSEDDSEEKRRALIHQLPADLQHKITDLERNCARVIEINKQSDEFVVDSNRQALQRLEWVYLKLLIARNNLLSTGSKESEIELSNKISAIEAQLQKDSDSEALRHSKVATLAILKERLANVYRRKETLEEVDSDLTRIESQVQLIIENASMQGKPQTISSDIELASNLLGTNLFGDSEVTIADLDQAYVKPQSRTKEAKREPS